MNKNNPCQRANAYFDERFKNHKCLHCKHVSNWDGYTCLKRKFYWHDYTITETLKSIKYNIGKLFDWYPASELFNNLNTVFENLFYWIPEKPIKKCDKFEFTDRKYFTLSITEMDGTLWLPDQDEPIIKDKKWIKTKWNLQ